MDKATWIWYPGEFEIYHSNKVHAMREDDCVDQTCLWQLPNNYIRCDFTKEFIADKDFTLSVSSISKGFVQIDYGKKYKIGCEIHVKQGEHKILVSLMNIGDGFNAMFIDSEFLKSDKSWNASNCIGSIVQADFNQYFDDENKNPLVFHFEYKMLQIANVEKGEQRITFDFGKETYARVRVLGADEKEKLSVCYGESYEEATDIENACIVQEVCGSKEYELRERAFSFVSIYGNKLENIKLEAQEQFLPIEDIGKFECENKEISDIYKLCSDTFHLNTREFYLDGIKRDHWIWSGDAYQSFKINRYLYFDNEITKRTIRALLGRAPYFQHINTINDYSMYMFLSVYEYYFATGDVEFVKSVYPLLASLYDFICNRLDDNGFVYEREEDWLFIDWSDIDKDGAVCAEQILLWKTNLCMSELSKICSKDPEKYSQSAFWLQKSIMEKFWSEEKCAFIDSFSSGKNHISRHANIFAILFDFVDLELQNKIAVSVLENDKITAITTPYFKFYELSALCKLGKIEVMQNLLEEYWGGMLHLGATSVWEDYDCKMSGAQHYEMYGAKYGKSLCHAWGCGPIYLLGKFVAGVTPTEVGYKKFEVKPNNGLYSEFNCTVPLPDNHFVKVSLKDGTYTVLTDTDGGVFVKGTMQTTIPANVSVEI